jgi:hypothetical protein
MNGFQCASSELMEFNAYRVEIAGEFISLPGVQDFSLFGRIECMPTQAPLNDLFSMSATK